MPRTSSSAASFIHGCRSPFLAELLQPRVVALSVAAFGAAQLIGSCFGVGVPCVFHRVTGLPCPGCGLTRSILALLRGHAVQSLAFHPFGPPLLLTLCFAALVTVLPSRTRGWLLKYLARLESRTAFIPILFAVLMLLWIVRLTGVLPLAPV